MAASSARSPKASKSRCLFPFGSQSRTTRSRPAVISRPSLANRTDATPPPSAAIALVLPPFSISHSRPVPSSLDDVVLLADLEDPVPFLDVPGDRQPGLPAPAAPGEEEVAVAAELEDVDQPLGEG